MSVFGPASSHGVTEQAISRTDLNRNPKLNPNPNPDLRSDPNFTEQEIMNDFQKPGFGLFAGTSLLTVTLWARRAATLAPTHPRPCPPLPAQRLHSRARRVYVRATLTPPYPTRVAPPLTQVHAAPSPAPRLRHVRAALHRHPHPVATCAR